MQGKMCDVCRYNQTCRQRCGWGRTVTNGGHSVMSGACGLVRADGSCRHVSAYTVLPLNGTAFDLPHNLLGEQGQDCNSHVTDQTERRVTGPGKLSLAQS